MKCIRCNHDSRFPERPGRRCPKCKGLFAFEPKEQDPVTDAMFKAAIEAVSAQGRLRWGVEHLYYELCRRKRPKFNLVGGFGCSAVLCLIGIALFAFGSIAKEAGVFLFGVVPFGFGLVSLVQTGSSAVDWARGKLRTVTIYNYDFELMWDRWCKVHGKPDGVIEPRPRPGKTGQAPRPVEPDLADYSFDRAVICDRSSTVDLLLANNFHFENNCAVLSIDGYPEGPFETVRTMLQRNPHLQVFVLHDASQKGCTMAHQLANDRKWFKGGVRVTDVGLRPVHARPFDGLVQKSPLNVSEGAGISAEEAVWLTDRLLELAAIRPEQVLKRLFKAIQRKFDPAADSGLGFVDSGTSSSADSSSAAAWTAASVEQDTDSFGTDAGDSDGGADGFG